MQWKFLRWAPFEGDEPLAGTCTGTPAEALAFAAQFVAAHDYVRIIAASVGPVEAFDPPADWIIIDIERRADGRGWSANGLGTSRTARDAIHYRIDTCNARARCLRIHGEDGALTQILVVRATAAGLYDERPDFQSDG